MFTPEPGRRRVSQVGLGRTLDEGAFRAAFVWGHNPAATLPDAGRVRRGLERDDLFVVVHELFMTETARRADTRGGNATNDDVASNRAASRKAV